MPLQAFRIEDLVKNSNESRLRPVEETYSWTRLQNRNARPDEVARPWTLNFNTSTLQSLRS